MDETNKDFIYTSKELEAIFKVSRYTLIEWEKKKWLIPLRKGPYKGKKVYLAEQVEKFKQLLINLNKRGP